MSKFIFVIDTNNYAGNFEREMCAYITGQFGECGVGDDVAEAARPNIRNLEWFKTHIKHKRDDSGCRRPVSIYATPGWFNNGMGGVFPDDGYHEVEAKEALVESMTEYHAGRYAMAIKRIAERNFEEGDRGWSEENCKREIARIDKELAQLNSQPLKKYPASNSVAIFFNTLPEGDVLAEMIERAKMFGVDTQGDRGRCLKSVADDFKVTGFRIIVKSETIETVAV